MSPQVFISHSVKDKDQQAADIIYDYLKNNGIEPYMDKRNLIPGIPYPTQLTQAIKESNIIVLILSTNSDSSEPVLNEVTLARANKRRIIPVRIEEIVPQGLALFLTATQWLDAFPSPIQNHLPKLLSAVKSNLEENGPVAPPPPPTPVSITSNKPPAIIRDHEWHDIEYEDLSALAKERIKELDAGKQITLRTFVYRRNRYTNKYQRKLKS